MAESWAFLQQLAVFVGPLVSVCQFACVSGCSCICLSACPCVFASVCMCVRLLVHLFLC